MSGCGGESETSLVRRRHDSAQEERLASPQVRYVTREREILTSMIRTKCAFCFWIESILYEKNSIDILKLYRVAPL